MLDGLGFAGLLAVWLAAAGGVLLLVQRSTIPTSGLTVLYIFMLWAFYWFGGAIHFIVEYFQLPDYYLIRRPQRVRLGLRYGTYAIVAFAISHAIALRYFGAWIQRIRKIVNLPNDLSFSASVRYLWIGILIFFLLKYTIIGGLPTITSFFSAGRLLIAVGLCLLALRALERRDYWQVVGWIGASLLLPFFTAAFLGFMGIGATITIVTVGIVLLNIRLRPSILVLGLIGIYMGLSLFVNYSQNRGNIRRNVWYERDVFGGVFATYNILADFEWFDPTDSRHLEPVDRRFNVNHIVGSAVVHRQRTGESAETVWGAAVAIIPRVVWPSKPAVTGGHALAERYTDIQYAETVSIGAGKVMEFYINFGVWGVLIGYAFFGVAIAYLDFRAGWALQRGDEAGFAQWFLPGLMFLKVLGPLSELTVRVIAAFVLMWGLNKIIGGEEIRSAARTTRPSPVRRG